MTRTPAPKPISLRPPADLLAAIDAAVPGSPQPNRTAWIVEACRQRLAPPELAEQLAAARSALLRGLEDHTSSLGLVELEGLVPVMDALGIPTGLLGEAVRAGADQQARDARDAHITRGHVLGTLEPGDHDRADCPYPAGCSGCTPATVQERAARGEPDAVARMRLAGELDPSYLTEAGLDHLRTVEPGDVPETFDDFVDDVDGDIEGADYPPQPEPVPPIAGADIEIEVTPVAGGALWRWKVAHPDLADPIEGSESFRSAILDNARRITKAKVGHGDFTLRLPKGVAR